MSTSNKQSSRLSEKEKLEKMNKMTPLDFVLKVMHDKDAGVVVRLEAAKIALPYIHKKMPIDLDHGGEITIIPPFVPSREELARQLEEENEDWDDL